MDEKHHEMILEKIHLTGVEEWHCPVCGRHFLVQWPPAYKMIVVEPGDKDTRHNVSKVNSRIGPLQITRTKETEYIEEFRLIPWLEWMEEVDFASRWDD
jgi:hypothetical protein